MYEIVICETRYLTIMIMTPGTGYERDIYIVIGNIGSTTGKEGESPTTTIPVTIYIFNWNETYLDTRLQ